MNVDNWSANSPGFHVGSQEIDSLVCIDFIMEVIVPFSVGGCQGCQ